MAEPTMSWTVGTLIRKAREDAALDQDQLADAVGVSRTKVSRWENGHTSPRIDELRKIIEITGARWLAAEISGQIIPLITPIRGRRVVRSNRPHLGETFTVPVRGSQPREQEGCGKPHESSRNISTGANAAVYAPTTSTLSA